MEFHFHYKKNSNDELFKELEKSDFLEVSNLQNYIPLYETFFGLGDNTCNQVNLNQKFR